MMKKIEVDGEKMNKATSPIKDKPVQIQTSTSQSKTKRSLVISAVGDAIQITFLLSDWRKFGLAERASYHFDLFETLTSTTEEGGTPPTKENGGEDHPSENSKLLSLNEYAAPHTVCGVVRLLECVPVNPWNRISKHQRRALRNRLRDFNVWCQKIRDQPPGSRNRPHVHRPTHLPLSLATMTRVSFAYQLTRVALVLDASPSLVSMYGISNSGEDLDCGGPCCALDRFPGMIKSFFMSLMEPVTKGGGAGGQTTVEWKPMLAVTVVALFSHCSLDENHSNTSILVRDYRVCDEKSAQLLVTKITQWALDDVEDEIARRLSLSGYGQRGSIPQNVTSLREVLDVGDVALSLLPSRGRPCIVLATDGRAVSCDGILDLRADPERVDNPLFVLDLSFPETHQHKGRQFRAYSQSLDQTSLVRDPGGPASFPLHMPDDCESLFTICKATSGAFFDSQLLELAAKTTVGQVPAGSPLGMDGYLTFKRRALKLNALQWYVLFSLSPLTPMFPAGLLPPPEYLRHRRVFPRTESKDDFVRQIPKMVSSVDDKMSLETRRVISRATFSTYQLSRVRIKGLLLARLREGYRVKLYGTSTLEPDKLSVQLQLPIESGTVIHYEVQYKALQGQNPLIGEAHVKIELSGESVFIQAVHNADLQQMANGNLSTASKIQSRLCNLLKSIHKEDKLQSFLCPMVWDDRLDSMDSPFVRRLGTLNHLQRLRNFTSDMFDVVCTGRMPYLHDDDLPVKVITTGDNGETELFEILSEWSTQIIEHKRLYVRKSDKDNLPSYCIVDISQSPYASRLFTVRIDTINAGSVHDKLLFMASLKGKLSDTKDLTVLPKLLNRNLVGIKEPSKKGPDIEWRHRLVSDHFDHESWDLVKDPEVVPLLTRRRSKIGNFLLLHSSQSHAIFAKHLSVATGRVADHLTKESYLVEYQIKFNEKSIPVVDMHVETEIGRFFVSSTNKADQMTRAHRMFVRVKRRDQECAVALRSRTNLLSLFTDSENVNSLSADEQKANVERLLPYSSRLSRTLRFFHGNGSAANKELETLVIDLILSDSLDSKVLQLSIDQKVKVGNQEAGCWFLIKFDRDTVSFVCLPSKETTLQGESEGSIAVRELSFYTFCTSDLYCVRNDKTDLDDDSTNDHVSEHLGVEGFADAVEAAHGKNYSYASYLALRNMEHFGDFEFEEADFLHALSFCAFSQVAEIFMLRENIVRDDASSRLLKTINTVLKPVQGNKFLMYYCADESQRDNSIFQEADDQDDSDVSFDQLSEDSEGEAAVEEHQATLAPDVLHLSMVDDDEEEEEGDEENSPSVTPPIFVKFALDGIDISHHALSSISKGGKLTASISIFRENCRSARIHNLPASHSSAAFDISSLLNSYIAGQTLERLRLVGPTIELVDLAVVRKCLRRARDVILSFLDVSFFVYKIDSMVRASNSAGNESEVEEGFIVFKQKLQEDEKLQVRALAPAVLFVMETNEENGGLEYWCLLSIKKSLGSIAVELFHPDGILRARKVLIALQTFIAKSLHRTNQQLLLKSLHQSRTASSLLLRRSKDSKDKEFVHHPGSTKSNTQFFSEGHFACPLVFKHSFPLYHRISAVQTLRSLESSVLHSFAVSNRSGVFVYKDEAGGIFYLSLHAGAQTDGTEYVELKVCGVDTPGPSITEQLTRLLQKKVLTNSVEALSQVLKKNPHYSWRRSDISFLNAFKSAWNELNDEPRKVDVTRTLEFPSLVHDPITLLIFFRQNLCGSTYFHRLCESKEDQGREEVHDSNTSKADEEDVDVLIDFDPNDFLFFYNNAPSPLDPAFQAVSTLTSKGYHFSREAGSGIAIIKTHLIGSSGSMSFITATPPGEIPSCLSYTQSSLRMRRIDGVGEESKTSAPILKFSVTATGLNVEAILDWLELTMNQALVSWSTERHIQRSCTGLLAQTTEDTGSAKSDNSDFAGGSAQIDLICPGLPALTSMLKSSLSMPHPAIEIVEFSTVLKASSVSSVTLSLLDCIMNSLFQAKSAEGKAFYDEVVMLRSTRSQTPTRVNLSKQENSSMPLIKILDGNFVRDSPIDCPEYLCFFSFQFYSRFDESGIDCVPPMLFKEVMVNDGIRDSRRSRMSEILVQLKSARPSAFRRSLCFVLSVKRNRRTLLTYNWDPQLQKSIVEKIKKSETSNSMLLGQSLFSQQQRCLGFLAPPVQLAGLNTSKKKNEEEKQGRNNDERGKTEEQAQDALNYRADGRPIRRIRRPTSILRPRLIGKSVEGGAIQAMAASRARASANRFKASAGGRQDKKVSRVPGTKKATDQEKSVQPAVKETSEEDSRASQIQLVKMGLSDAVDGMKGSRFGMSQQMQNLMLKYWFSPAKQPVLAQIRELVLSKAISLFSETSKLLATSRTLANDISSDLAQYFQSRLSELGQSIILPTDGHSKNAYSVDYIMTALRSVVLTSFLVTKLSIIKRTGARRPEFFVCVDTWMLRLPRANGETVKNPRGGLKHRTRRSCLLESKIEAAREILNVESRLLDFACSQIHKAVALENTDSIREKYILMSDELYRGYSYEQQQSFSDLQYRIFEATIVLSSYRDAHISKFNAFEMFDRLAQSKNGILRCGHNSLCFRQPLQVAGTLTVCFLKQDISVNDRFMLHFICRTGGFNLDHYVFPDGSNVGSTHYRLIAVEGARVALTHLRPCAIGMYVDRLWKSFTNPGKNPRPETLEELKRMVQTTSILDNPHYYLLRSLLLTNDIVKMEPDFWLGSMLRDPLFGPTHTFRGNEKGSLQRVLHASRMGVLILFSISNGELKSIEVLDRDKRNNATNDVCEMLVNYILHLLWKTL